MFHVKFQSVEKFIQIVCYPWKEGECLTETRVLLYKQMKAKTSQSLPTEEKWMSQAIKRVYYQVFYSSRVDENHHT